MSLRRAARLHSAFPGVAGRRTGPRRLFSHGLLGHFLPGPSGGLRRGGSFRRLYGVNGKLRADDLTVVTVDAFIRLENARRVVTLFIEFRRELKDPFRAELDAVSATLASVLEDVNDAA